ncbi:MAG: Type secretion system protein [Pseudomonadota bacterium]|jgi:type IV pilus assembly protein PilB
MSNPRTGLAARLVSQQLLSDAQVAAATETARRSGVTLVRQLIRTRLLERGSLSAAVAEEFSLPLLDLSAFDLSAIPGNLLDLRLLSKHRALPLFHRANRLFVALSDPTDAAGLDAIRFHTGMAVEAVAVDEDQLAMALRTVSGGIEQGLPQQVGDQPLSVSALEVPQADPAPGDDAPRHGVDDAPVVRFVNQLLLEAVRQQASDIHIEPFEKIFRIRFRIDGLLHEIDRPAIKMAGRIVSRLKILSRMDISERRLPQDGRIKLVLGGNRNLELRVNSLPTLWGEKLVLRLLDPSQVGLDMDTLGFEPGQLQLYLSALQRPQGMILVTGPTGSGKTRTLYAGLNRLNTPERNISTVEDPVEMYLEGINQLQVHPRIGMTFASALRALLRQDPDILMVGEVRDLETAEIAVKAAQTGHLLLSTLHTNNAAETLSRLRGMGLPAYNLASSIALIIAQRLVRRLCSHCKESISIPDNSLLEAGFQPCQLNGLRTFRAVGCRHCRDGYLGRIGIYEVVPISTAMTRIIMGSCDTRQLSAQSRQEGFLGLRQSALLKVAQGLTSLDEVSGLT